MKKHLLFLLLVSCGLSCQQDDAEFSVKPTGQYNDEAQIALKVFCNSADCESPFAEEQYVYNTSGKRTRTNFLSRGTSGKLELNAYIEQTYNSGGQLMSKIRYGKYGNSSEWVAYDESAYEYVNDELVVERQYFNQRNPDQKVLTGLTEYIMADGKKVGMKMYDARKQLNYQVTYEYTNNVLTRETHKDATDKVMRYFEHAFAGSRRQISEYWGNRPEAISMVEKGYDKQGRLVSEETKVSNPLLCSMMPGVVRYGY